MPIRAASVRAIQSTGIFPENIFIVYSPFPPNDRDGLFLVEKSKYILNYQIFHPICQENIQIIITLDNTNEIKNRIKRISEIVCPYIQEK
jgi:hypothetical protein